MPGSNSHQSRNSCCGGSGVRPRKGFHAVWNCCISHTECWPLVSSGCLKPFCNEVKRGMGFPCGSDGKATAYNAGDLGSIPGSGSSPGDANGSPLQYSCLENPMDRGAWRATVHRVARSQTGLRGLGTRHAQKENYPYKQKGGTEEQSRKRMEIVSEPSLRQEDQIPGSE